MRAVRGFLRRCQWARHASRDESGAILALAAIALVATIATAAVVVDLSASRNDRSLSQVAVDAATASAGIELGDNGAQAACEIAFDYLGSNLGESLAGANCATMPYECTDFTVPVEVAVVSGDIRATVVHPVSNSHIFMASSTAGTPTQAISEGDGLPCDRIAVSIERDRTRYFGGFIGAEEATTTIHSVARAVVSDEQKRPVHLLLLNREECNVINVSSASSGGLYVRPTTDPDTGEVFAGFIASDSSGTVGCGSNGILDVDGNGAEVRADGDPGCDDELYLGTGAGCGVLEIFGATTEGCVLPACSSSGTVAPEASRLGRRITRAPVDHRFNCEGDYTDLDIRACRNDDGSQPWIDQLVQELGRVAPPVGYLDYVSHGYPCSINGGPSTVVTIPEGNWWIDCGDLNIKRTLEFLGGNIVLTGDLTIQAGGDLQINTANTETYDWTWPEAFDPYENSPTAGVLVLQSGQFKQSSGASVRIEHTTIYMGADASLAFNGGQGSVFWSAPNEGPFEDLALWSESANGHDFAGSASLTLDGVFFAPNAEIRYQGNGSGNVVQAQFIADKLTVGGSGGLELAPYFHRIIQVTAHTETGLIR